MADGESEKTPLIGKNSNSNLECDGLGEPSCKETKDGSKTRTLWSLPAKKKLLLLCLTLTEFSEAVLMSMIAPFFPLVAEQRGIASVYVGIVFAVFALVVLLSAPVWGRLVEKTGPKAMFVTGLLVCGSAAILFGVLYYTPDNATFVWMSVLSRCVESLAASAYFTSSFTIVASAFPDNMATVLGILSAGNGLGFIVGPLIGGGLFQAIGYTAALSAAGALLYLIAITGAFVIPPDIIALQLEKRSWVPMLKDTHVLLTLFTVFICLGVIGFIDSMHVLSLQKFNLSVSSTSLVFLPSAIAHGICVIIIGNLSDRFPLHSQHIIIGGLLVILVGTLLYGPAPFLFIPDSVTLRLVGVGIMFAGLSISPVYFRSLHDASQRLRMPDDLATHGMISGLFVSADNGGLLWGPLVGGALYDKIGFAWVATIFGTLVLLTLILQVILLVSDYVRDRKGRTKETYG